MHKKGIWTPSTLSSCIIAEHALRPFVAGVAVPLFAFTSAGVALNLGGSGSGDLSLAEAMTQPVTLGVLVGLLVGKPIGVIGGASLMARYTRASLNPALRLPSWRRTGDA